jgi:lysine 2,3-aminomutase
MVIHTNHLQEIDEEVEKALKLLTQNHINCLTQSVLLNGVNNSTSELTKLFEKLISLNIRPYYLHHPDHVYGGMHFYLSLEEGRKIYAKLRSHLPGWSLPHYVIDPSNGIGKTLAYNPESMQYSGQITDQDGSIHSMHF